MHHAQKFDDRKNSKNVMIQSKTTRDDLIESIHLNIILFYLYHFMLIRSRTFYYCFEHFETTFALFVLVFEINRIV